MSSRVMTKLLIMMRTKTTVSKYLFSINLEQRRNTFTGPPVYQVPADCQEKDLINKF